MIGQPTNPAQNPDLTRTTGLVLGLQEASITKMMLPPVDMGIETEPKSLLDVKEMRTDATEPDEVQSHLGSEMTRTLVSHGKGHRKMFAAGSGARETETRDGRVTETGREIPRQSKTQNGWLKRDRKRRKKSTQPKISNSGKRR